MFQGGFGTGSSNTFGSTFNKPAASFGTGATPVFGNTGGSLFGTTQPATNSLFGAANPAPAFGQPQTTTSFGGFSSGTGTGLFGNNQNASTSSGLFGSTNTSAFGQAKPAFGGFGPTQTTPGLFGQQTTAQQQPATGGLFGQTAAASSTTGLFGSSAGGFGSTAAANGTAVAKFVAVTGNDTMVKNGVSQTISTRHHCITCMKEYEGKSLEELRMEDYAANRKGPQQGVQPSGGLFGATQQPGSLFGNANTTPAQSTSLFGASTENKSLFGSTVQSTIGGFGQMNNAFGSPSNSLFGKPTTAAPAFGTNTNTNTFGFNTNTNTTNPFGSQQMATVKPFGSTQPNLFGAGTSQQPAPVFGTTTPAFGTGTFGTTPATQAGGLFGQKPTGFGAGTSTFSFGQTPATSTQPGTSLFGAKPAGSAFGSPFGTTPAAGTGTAFGNTTLGAANQNNSLFGNNTFKPPTSNFSFGPTPNTSTPFGGGTSLFGNTANKPTSLFGNTAPGTGMFSNAFSAGTNTFGTGANTSLNMGMPMGSMLGGSMFSTGNQTAQPTVNNLNQHMLALSSMPFGDNPLFKSLLPSSGKMDELLKPAPAANQKSLLNGQNYKVSASNASKIKMKPIGSTTVAKLSLFEGLEEDPNYFQKMQMKPTIKRLNLQSKGSARSPGGGKATPDLPSGISMQDSFADNSPRYFTPLDNLATSPVGSPRINTSKGDQTPISTPKTTHSADKTDKSNTALMSTSLQSPDNTITELSGGKPPPSTSGPSAAASADDTATENKENADQSSSSNSSESEACVLEPGSEEPHPSGVVLRRVGYYTIPSMESLAALVDADGRCIVDNFTVGRYNYGNIFFPDSFDVSGLNLDEIVHFRHKEVTVYPDEATKPAAGTGLNRPAQVTLDRVWPLEKISRRLISEPDQLEDMDYERTLRLACAKMAARFKEYRPATGSWVFKVDHFSKYGLSDSDEEEASATDIKKLRLNTAPPTAFPPGPKEVGLKRGLDGRWAPPLPPAATPTSGSILGLDEDDQDMDLDQTPFLLGQDDMAQSQLSPTMQMAQQMGASSRKVQLMKASFYNDDADDYPIDGDLVDFRMGSGGVLDVEEFDPDQSHKLHKSFPLFRTQFAKYDQGPSPVAFRPQDDRTPVDTESSGISVGPLPPVMPVAPPLPPVKPQHRTLKHPDGAVVAYEQSLADRPDVKARSAVDLGLFRARSFRVGWSRDLSLASLSTRAVAATVEWSAPLHQLGTLLCGRPTGDLSPQIVQRVRLLPGHHDDTDMLDFKVSIEEHLETALDHSLWSEGEEGCARVGPRAGVAALHTHCAIAQRASTSAQPSALAACHVWELCVALWGQLPDLPAHDSPQSHLSVMCRRAAVSDWLESVVREATRADLAQNVSEPANVFALLTGHCVLDACNRALSSGDHYTALLLSGAPDAGPMLEQQLAQWVETEADQLIDPHRLKQMMLVAGVPVLSGSGSSHNTVNVCQGLDWRRAFAVHLWYMCSPVASVTDALLRYEAAFREEGEGYAAPPLPAHCPEWESSRPIYDVCFHLLKLFSSRAHPLAPLLNPATHTADPLDYRLSWLLLRTVESLGYSHVSALCAANVHTAFAAQLEAHGLWHWAAFALLHIADAQQRAMAIQEVLGRHVDLDTEPEKEEFLIKQLRIPAQWVYQAKATYAAAHFRFREAAEFLLLAEQWNEAHKVIVEHISARCIINEEYEYLGSLLRRLEPQRSVVSGWGHQGALLADYLAVVGEVDDLVQRRDPAVGYQLERLQPKLSALCGRIHQLPTPTTLHRLCQAEIAKRAVHLIRTLLIVQRGSSAQSLGMSTNVLAHLVNQLPLPEDYSKQELRELTDSLVTSVAVAR